MLNFSMCDLTLSPPLGSLLSNAKYIIDENLRVMTQSLFLPTPLERTSEAINYALFLGGGGKRIRSATALATACAIGAQPQSVLPEALGIELIHTYTLILDDIQDDDALRRGLPATHVAFDFDTAILAAERLYAHGLILLSGSTEAKNFHPYILRLLDELHQGQAADLVSSSYPAKLRTMNSVEFILDGKTGALFEIAMSINGMKKNDRNLVNRLGKLGRRLGFLFQATDDLLEKISDQATLGKPVNKDRGEKLTFTSLFSDLDDATAFRDAYLSDTKRLLDEFEPTAADLFKSLLDAATFRSS